MNGTNIVVSSRHALEEFEELLKELTENTGRLRDPELLLVLPDRISINNAREAAVRMGQPSAIQSIHMTTIEDLASEILDEVGNRRPAVVSGEIRRLLLVQTIKRMKRGKKPDPVARRIWRLVQEAEFPENEDAVKAFEDEFDEFLRCAYPPSLHRESSEFYEEMECVAKDITDPFVREQTREGIHFYEALEENAKQLLESLPSGRGMLLSRAHLVGEAAELISKNPDILRKALPNVTRIIVSGISVFDTTALKFLLEVGKTFGSLRFNTGSLTAERLAGRLRNLGLSPKVLKGKARIKSSREQVRLLEVPDPRREVKQIAESVSREIAGGERGAGDVLVVSRDSGRYLPYVEEVVKEYGLTAHVQTRRNFALTPVFRMVDSVLSLLAKAEMDQRISSSDITDCLRLGFRPEKNKIKPLADRTFLWIESSIGFSGRGKEAKWSEWRDTLRKHKSSSVRSLAKFVESNKGKEASREIIEQIVVKFGKGCSSWVSPLRLDIGYSQNRPELCEQHVTSHVGRLFGVLHELDQYVSMTYELRGERGNRTWRDYRRAFLSVGGGMTYGLPQRDAQALRFVDAGNSHFLSAGKRFVVGLRAGEFPRECPRGLLLHQDYRKALNRKRTGAYLRGPETDYENEKDLFEAAIGPENEESSIICLMPYLDDRGHRQNWSTFLHSAGIPDHVSASHLIAVGSLSPSECWRDSARRVRQRPNVAADFVARVPSMIRESAEKSISARLGVVERIVRGEWTLTEIDLDQEPYLTEYVNSIRSDAIPAHEIDLYEECPRMYYFYVYLFLLSSGTNPQAKRFVVPEWKYDFRLGVIPLPVRRRHVSSEMSKILGDIITNHQTTSELESDKSEILDQIASIRGVENMTKEKLRRSVEFLVDAATPRGRIEHRDPGECSGDTEIWRPSYIVYSSASDNRRRMVFFARCVPRRRNRNKYVPAVLHHRFGKRVVVAGHPGREYGRLHDDDVAGMKDGIRSLIFPPPTDPSRCADCVYDTLCRVWGF